eukprot:3954676-Prorocentrum_lima.AAC.1
MQRFVPLEHPPAVARISQRWLSEHACVGEMSWTKSAGTGALGLNQVGPNTEASGALRIRPI